MHVGEQRANTRIRESGGTLLYRQSKPTKLNQNEHQRPPQAHRGLQPELTHVPCAMDPPGPAAGGRGGVLPFVLRLLDLPPSSEDAPEARAYFRGCSGVRAQRSAGGPSLKGKADGHVFGDSMRGQTATNPARNAKTGPF